MDPLTLKAASAGAGGQFEAGVEAVQKTGPSRFDEMSQKISSGPVAQSTAVPEPQTANLTSPAGMASTVNDQLRSTGASLERLHQRVQAAPPTAEMNTLQTMVQQLAVRFNKVGDSIRQASLQSNPQKLLVMQANVYQVSEDVELLSKMVDQATSGVKSLLQTQVG